MVRSRVGVRSVSRQVRVLLPPASFLLGVSLVGNSFGWVSNLVVPGVGVPAVLEPATPATDQRVVTGKVTFVEEGRITVDVNGENVKIAVGAGTKITRRGETIALMSITVGESVTCTLSGPNDSPEASEIKVVTG